MPTAAPDTRGRPASTHASLTMYRVGALSLQSMTTSNCLQMSTAFAGVRPSLKSLSSMLELSALHARAAESALCVPTSASVCAI